MKFLSGRSREHDMPMKVGCQQISQRVPIHLFFARVRFSLSRSLLPLPRSCSLFSTAPKTPTPHCVHHFCLLERFLAGRFKEIERRREAHKERERKKKESEALAARLKEYAKHADEDEEEFLAGGGDTTATPATTTDGADNTDGAATPAADGDGASAATGRDSAGVTTADGGSSSSSSAERTDVKKSGHAAADGQPGSVAGGPSEGSREEPRAGADEVREDDQKIGEGESGPAVASVDAAASAAAAVPTEPAAEKADESDSTAAVAIAAPASTGPLPSAPAAVTPPAAVSATARPKIVRTYGRKPTSRDSVDGDGGAASADPAASQTAAENAGDAPTGGGRGKSAMTAESQALWEEGEGDDQRPEVAGASLGEEDSVGLSLGLDGFSDGDSDHGGDGEGSTDQAEDGETATAEQVTGPSSMDGDGSQPETGTKRKHVEPPSSGGGGSTSTSHEAAGAVSNAVPGETAAQTAEAPTPEVTSPTDKKADAPAAAGATTAAASSSYVKMKLAAGGGLEAAPVQPSLSNFFQQGAGSTSSQASASAAVVPLAKKSKGIAAFFGAAGKDATAAVAAGSTSTAADSTGAPAGAGDGKDTVTAEAPTSAGAKAPEPAVVEGSDDPTAAVAVGTATGGSEKEDTAGEAAAPKEEQGEEQEEEEDEEEGSQELKEPKDRSAKYRAMLEAERAANKKAKKLRKSGMMDDEAEEEEEEEAVRGLGDFGFGVPAGGTGTSAAGGAKKDDDEEDDIDEEIREEVSARQNANDFVCNCFCIRGLGGAFAASFRSRVSGLVRLARAVHALDECFGRTSGYCRVFLLTFPGVYFPPLHLSSMDGGIFCVVLIGIANPIGPPSCRRSPLALSSSRSPLPPHTGPGRHCRHLLRRRGRQGRPGLVHQQRSRRRRPPGPQGHGEACARGVRGRAWRRPRPRRQRTREPPTGRAHEGRQEHPGGSQAAWPAQQVGGW